MLVVALAGLTAELIVATMVAVGGTVDGLTKPRPTPPATSELKSRVTGSLCLEQLSVKSSRRILIKLKNRGTVQGYSLNKDGKGRHFFSTFTTNFDFCCHEDQDRKE